MELRVLQYFLAVAREQNISAAAQSLHLTQPTLSRQLRELEEEVGVTCGELAYLGCLYSSPGFSTEVLHMYLARDLEPGVCHPDDDEFLECERIPFDQLVEQVVSGVICDAKTVALVLKAKAYLGR